MDILLLFSTFALVVCCKRVIGIDCKGKQMGGKDFVPCGDNMCCCSRNMISATCNNFERNRTDIPPLPTTITSLYVRNSSLPIVSRCTFDNIRASTIKILGLIANHIISITDDAFLDFKALHLLDLSDNQNLNISSLSSSFNSLPNGNLRLYLKNIGMTNITDYFQTTLCNKTITSMELSGNRFKVLNFSAFRKLIYLSVLKCSNSGIYDTVTDIGLPSLKELDLSYNQIGCRPITLCLKDGHDTVFTNLQRLHLQANFLTAFVFKDFACLKRLRYLDIGKNFIVKLQKNMFAGLASLTELRMSNMNGRITEIEDLSFNSSSLTRLKLDGNAINFKSTMTNIFIGCLNLKLLSVSENNFHNINDSEIIKLFSPLKNLTTLIVKNANMRLPEGLLAVIPNLEYLFMDNNKNGLLTLGVSLKNTRKLKVVSLQGNSIRIVDQISFNGYTMGSIQILDLSLNPFECKCENMWFRNAIDSQGKIGNITLQGWPFYYRCYTGGHTYTMKNPMFASYKPTKYSCQNNLLIALICLIFLVILSSVTVIMVYRYRLYLTYWVYKAKSRRDNPERQPLLTNEDATIRQGVAYDAYVIYDSADARFVHHDFRLLMEERFGYKLHIWERDASAGETKVTVVADAMYASKYVVAVISGDVLKDSWLQFQINIAIDRQIDLNRDFLILVLLENIDYKKLNKFWCVLFTRLLSTQWCTDKNNVKRKVFEQQILKHFGKTFHESL